MALPDLTFRTGFITLAATFLRSFCSNRFSFSDCPTGIRVNGLAIHMWLYGWVSHGEEVRFFVDIAVCAGGMTMAILTDAGRFIGVVLVVPI